VDNLTIRKAKSTEKNIISEIVNIHLATFEGFFLTFMGKGFLHQMYTAYTKHAKSNILIAVDTSNNVMGFLAYSEHMSDLYRYMIKHHLLQFAWYSIGAFLRKPKIFMRLIRAFLKPSESLRDEKYIELASIGVHPDVKSKGIGSCLINALKNEIDFDAFQYITLETDVVNNEIANKFYAKNGFCIAREYNTREGRRMYEYRYEGGGNIEKAETSLHTEYS
jgi:ribosomal protein S18 acetylase RimI-like enzyme